MLVDRVDDRLESPRVPPGQFLEFLVEWMLEEVIVDVPHQVEMAFLLRAIHRVVSRVEVRHENACEISERLLEECPPPRRAVEIDDDLRPREDPDVAAPSPDFDLRLVAV